MHLEAVWDGYGEACVDPRGREHQGIVIKTGVERRGPQGRKEIFYRVIVRSLLYLSTHAPPGIAFSVSILNRFVGNPMTASWVAANRLFCYLHGAPETGITIEAVTNGLRMQNGHLQGWQRKAIAPEP